MPGMFDMLLELALDVVLVVDELFVPQPANPNVATIITEAAAAKDFNLTFPAPLLFFIKLHRKRTTRRSLAASDA
jgi:hypothetical protein